MHTKTHSLIASLRVEQTGVPIYVQLRDQCLRALAAGTLAPGAQMPTMRQVAVALKIDLNTVRHAYDELERLGAITLVRGRGSFVSDRPPPVETADGDIQIDNLARQVLATARALGLDPQALAQRITVLSTKKELEP
jgi:GntR family transcriptional regulator